MRGFLIVLLAVLPGCVSVLGRSGPDVAVSLASGRDCSIVRLDQGLTYCAPREAPERAATFCTRSLGVVDCWADPALLPTPRQGVAESPPPSDEQLRYRAARWPKSLNLAF